LIRVSKDHSIFLQDMPTLTRLIFIILLVGLLIYAVMWGLVLFVRPVTTQLSVEIEQSEIELKPWPYP